MKTICILRSTTLSKRRNYGSKIVSIPETVLEMNNLPDLSCSNYTNIIFSEETYSYISLPGKDLRISITSACNMACSYCHNEGCSFISQLSIEQVKYIVKESMCYGVKSIKITGGEPLLHPDVYEICRHIKSHYNGIILGINTNGIERNKILYLVQEKLVDRIVFGIDLFDGVISKNSTIGLPSKTILDTVLAVKRLNSAVEIDMVFNNDYENLLYMIQWCLKNKVILKVLEIIDDQVYNLPDRLFTDAIKKIMQDLDLKAGLNLVYNDPYLFDLHDADKIKIFFYHSLCRTRECSKCAKMHMRITCTGKAKPCLINPKTEFPLLGVDFHVNMRKAICAMGISPKCEVHI